MKRFFGFSMIQFDKLIFTFCKHVAHICNEASKKLNDLLLNAMFMPWKARTIMKLFKEAQFYNSLFLKNSERQINRLDARVLELFHSGYISSFKKITWEKQILSPSPAYSKFRIEIYKFLTNFSLKVIWNIFDQRETNYFTKTLRK